MKFIVTIFTFFFLISCSTSNFSSTSLKSDSLIVDSKYYKGIWSSYFKTSKTPKGVTIKLNIINDTSYHIQWGDSLKLKTYPQTFYLDGHEAWIPYFVAENRDYVVLKQGCGNPCWSGYFLPLNDSLKPYCVSEYLDYDLDNSLVASVRDTNVIQIVNLKTGLIENHIINGCSSAFLGYCLDSVSVKNKTLKYKWIPKTTIDSDEGIVKEEKIKI